MAAIDTIAFFSTQGAASPFPTGQTAQVEGLFYAAGGNQRLRVASPNLHDNQTGLTFEPLESPAQFLIPQDAAVNLQANDQLTVQGGIAAAGTIAGAIQVYYSQLPGIQARLHSWGDISGNYRYIKSV